MFLDNPAVVDAADVVRALPLNELLRGEPYFNESYWRRELTQRDYYDPELTFDQYRAALGFGTAHRMHGRARELSCDIQIELAERWRYTAGHVAEWDKVAPAVCDAWERAEETIAHPFLPMNDVLRADHLKLNAA
jgi:hypothetical protein